MTDQSSSSREQLTCQWQQGYTKALTPTLPQAIEKSDEVVTRSSSPWIHQRQCPRCLHTFRIGDRVTLHPGNPTVHAKSMKFCQSSDSSEPQTSSETDAFFRGLDRAWQPPEDLLVTRLESGHELLAPPANGRRRRSCAVCHHTFRSGDRVIICPCNPAKPFCSVAVHRDPIQGLNCWQIWNPNSSQAKYCLMTSAESVNSTQS